MSPLHSEHYRRWAEPFWQDIRGDVGCVEGKLHHLWHGDLENRRYLQRYQGFLAYDFDPALDLSADPAGAWRWGREREDMHRHVADYFQWRRENGPMERPVPVTTDSATEPG